MVHLRQAILFAAAVAFVAHLIVPDTWRWDNSQLKNKRVAVCGASAGIGREIALQYCAAQANVLIVARRRAVLDEVAQECRNAGAASVHISASDLTKDEGIEAVISSARSDLGGLDHLILNHVVGYWGKWTEEADPANTLDFLTRINFRSYALLATKAMPMLTNSNGAIAVVSSFGGKMGLPRIVPYAATKHALRKCCRQKMMMKKKIEWRRRILRCHG